MIGSGPSSHALLSPGSEIVGAQAKPAPIGSVRSDLGMTMHAVAAAAWDGLVAEFDEVCQEQTHVFASRRWPSVVLDPVVFAFGDAVVGGAQVMIAPLPLKIGAVAVVNRGPLLRCAEAADRRLLHRAMVDRLVREYAGRRRMMLSIQLCAPTTADTDHLSDLIDRGFLLGSELPFPDRYIVGLQRGDEAHRKSLHHKWRYHLAKSEQQSLAFEIGAPDALERFASLYEAMRRRKKFPDYSAYAVLPAQVRAEPSALRPMFFFVRHGDETVAGAAILAAGQTATYLYGATTDCALPLRAGYFLHWNIIRWLKRHSRARWYDLGGCDGFHGLHQFKKGLVGNDGVIAPMPPWANYASGRLPLLLGRGAFAARDALYAATRLLRSRDNSSKPDLVPRKARRE